MLRKQQRLFRAQGDELLAELIGASPCEWERLSQLRWNLVRLHVEMMAGDERRTCRSVQRGLHSRSTPPATSFARQREANLARLEDHMIYWTRARIEQDWIAYTAEARQLVNRLNAAMEPKRPTAIHT